MAYVLIADDNRDIRELLVALFRLRGHDAHAFADGASLLAHLRDHPADLCMIDWMMPGMDGPTVLSSIRDDPDPRTAATPVAMLTSDDRPDHRYVARRSGAQTFFNKATRMSRLFDDLAPWLDRPHAARVAEPESATATDDAHRPDRPADRRADH